MKEGFGGVQELLSPFNLANWFVTALTLAPGIAALNVGRQARGASSSSQGVTRAREPRTDETNDGEEAEADEEARVVLGDGGDRRAEQEAAAESEGASASPVI